MQTGYHFDKANHLHILDGKALTGTSSISKVLYKPLEYWASGKALELLGWTPTKTSRKKRENQALIIHGDICKMDNLQYLDLLDKAYHNHRNSLKKSAEKGIDLHAELEKYINFQMGDSTDDNYNERITYFIEWAEKNVSEWLWSEAHCYSKKLWVGGICDAGARLKDNTIALIDFKSSKTAYFSHYLQCAGYSILIDENGLLNDCGEKIGTLDGKVDRLIVFPFGAKKLKPHYNKFSIDDLKDGFKSALHLYRLMM